jgi:hypothetical protein
MKDTKSRTVEALANQASVLRDYIRPIEAAMFTAQRCSKIVASLELEMEADDAVATKIRTQTAGLRAAIGNNDYWRQVQEDAWQVERELIRFREQHGKGQR